MATKRKYQEADETINKLVEDLVCQLCRSYPRPWERRWYKCSELHHICELCVETRKAEKCPCLGNILKKVDKMTEILLKLKDLKFECRHCYVHFFREDIKIHESGCVKRLVPCLYANYDEPYKCNLLVTLDNILDHCESTHRTIGMARNGVTCCESIPGNTVNRTKLNKITYSLLPTKIEAYGKIFIRSGLTKDGIFYEWVTLIGSPLESKGFMFNLEYKGPESINVFMVFMGKVASLEETLDSIIASGKCSCIGFEPFKNQFMEENSNLSSSVTIKKIDE